MLLTRCKTWPVQTWVSIFLALSLLALPLSSSAKSVFIVVAMGLILFSPVYRRDLLNMIYEPWCQAAIVLFLISVIACAWSPATLREKLMEIEKYSKLLYLPVLVAGFRDPEGRRMGLNAYLLAMVITIIASMVMYFGLYSFHRFHNAEPSGIFRNHIMTGYMMAFAAYLASVLFLQYRGKVRIVYGVLALLFTCHVLFINNGRTGYVVFLLLMVLLMIQYFSWRQALLGIALGCSLVVATYYVSPVMHDAINRAITEYNQYGNNDKNTAIGLRLQFHDYAYELFKRHPWIGNGTASFMHLFNEEKPIPACMVMHVQEPHSQYWLIASEFGLLGCLALAFFYGSLFVSSLRLKTLRPIALAILLPFFLGNLSDSLLFYSGTGYFFILFMALCFGERAGKGSNDVA